MSRDLDDTWPGNENKVIGKERQRILSVLRRGRTKYVHAEGRTREVPCTEQWCLLHTCRWLRVRPPWARRLALH